MSDKKPVRDDVSQKIFFKNPERFADFCNAVLYDGEQRILESEVHPLDSDVSGIIRGSYGEESLERRRDVLRQVEGRGNILIVGIENQSHIHYAMPLRTITYDVLGYIDEAKAIERVFLQGDKEALEQYEEISINTELADILGTIIKSKFIIQQSETKGEVKMCTMLDEMERAAEERGEERGEKRGKIWGELLLVIKKLQKNKSTAVIADELEEDLAVIERMISTIQKHAPDYDINAITKEYQESFNPHN